MNIKKLIETDTTGTPPRDEHEFKTRIKGSDYLLKQNNYLLSIIRQTLTRTFAIKPLWKAPELVGSDYYVFPRGSGTFCFIDIYLDTPDQFNLRNGISYRVRYRWHSRGAFRRYISGSLLPEDFPHRCEYQIKVYRKEWINGYNNCEETRFEFRNQSKPFLTKKNAPPPPWPFEDYITPAITGKYKDFKVNTPKVMAEIYAQKNPETATVVVRPELIVATTRRRIHIGLPNEFGITAAKKGWGSIENAYQTMLITLDSVEVYSPDLLKNHLFAKEAFRRNSLTKRLIKRLKNSEKPLGKFTEIEFEFERNVESVLKHQIEQATDPVEKQKFVEIHSSILQDMETIKQAVSKSLAETGLTLTPGELSKYRKSASFFTAQ
jgi:hypothetical protein